MRSKQPNHAIFTVASAVLLVSGCSKEPTPRPEQKQTAPAARTAAPTAMAAATATGPELPGGSEANQIFKTRCVVCHGESGEGNGAGAAALTVKPRNYTDAKWQKSVTDDQLKEIIVKGGGAVGKDPGMPANPDLKSKPEIVEGLVKIVRSFGPKEAEVEPSGDAGAAKPKPGGENGQEKKKSK